MFSLLGFVLSTSLLVSPVISDGGELTLSSEVDGQYLVNLANMESLETEIRATSDRVNVVFEISRSPELKRVVERGQELVDKNSLIGDNYLGDISLVEENLRELESFLDDLNTEHDYVVLTNLSEKIVEKYKKGEVTFQELKKKSKKTIVKNEEDMVFLPGDTFIKAEIGLSDKDEERLEELIREVESSLDRVVNLDNFTVEVTDISTLSEDELDGIASSLPRDLYLLEKLKKVSQDMPSLEGYKNGYLDDEVLCPISFSPDYKMYCPAEKMLSLMNEDYKEEFGTDLKIVSAYRSFEHQASLYARDQVFVAVPGTSQHSNGLAIDFGSATGGFIDWDEPTTLWVMENGYKYGYSMGVWQSKENLPEPWHVEFGTFLKNEEKMGLLTKKPLVEFEVIEPERP